MLCEKCRQKEANIQLQLRVNGQQENHFLCSSCYKEEKNKLGALSGQLGGFGSFSPQSFFGGGSNNNQPFMPDQAMNPQQMTTTREEQKGLLDQFGRNLTNNAKAGLIDPVIGRENEVKRVIEILNRRTKNNPVLIGEPGVGKTAIAEGLALKIAEGSVPAKLQTKEVYLLDVASLVANTGIRGQFEERMKQLIAELQARKNVILFIDEVHQLVGAGSAEGSMDAGNILKPALARGELQLIGATTLAEYRQIEKDGALERRFQPVIVNEPTTGETLDILKGLKDRYEGYHNVSYSDDALVAAVELSHRYIQDRFLPDKAIDLMDEAGSKLNLTIETKGEKEIQAQLVQLHKDKEAALKNEEYEKAAKLRDEEQKLEKMLETGAPEDKPVVTVAHIQEIIATKTGIPVGKMQEDEATRMKNLQAELEKKVIGQDEAVKKVAKAIRRSRAGLKAKDRPIGSFLFVGPTGVGKTELSKALAEELFGTKDSMIRLDMSEYMEKHSVSKLIGSPPGYIGHDEAGQLTEKVRRNPYSIVLLDEIEKAHPDVMHMFLQIMEDGRLTDSQGRTVNFKNTVLIMTSNAGTGDRRTTVGFNKDGIEQEVSILQALSDYFKPEFLNRFDSIIEFNSLTKENLIKIVDIMLVELHDMLTEEGITLEVPTEVKEKLAAIGYDPKFGARPLRRAIQEHLEDNIADHMYEEPEAKQLKAVLEDDTIKITKK
ncbi:MAG: ATP-dependent Clp protease ATP-binding subunit [Bacillus sp. (in: firmicutes)]